MSDWTNVLIDKVLYYFSSEENNIFFWDGLYKMLFTNTLIFNIRSTS